MATIKAYTDIENKTNDELIVRLHERKILLL